MKYSKIFIIISLSTLSCGCSFSQYYATYTATCSINTGNATEKIHSISSDMAAQFNLTVQLDINKGGAMQVLLDLPEIQGAPPYRPNSSGQISITYNSYFPNQIGVLLIKTPFKEDDIARRIRKAIEIELRKEGCSSWIVDEQHTVLM